MYKKNFSSADDQRDGALPEHFSFSFNEPFTISTGSAGASSASVSIPIDPTTPKKALIETNGSGGAVFKNWKVYRFKKYKAKRENEAYFAELKTRSTDRDGGYIDMIFGEKSSKHSHVGFTGSSSLFLHLRTGGSSKGLSMFEEGKGIARGYRFFTDKPSGQTIAIDFLLNPESQEIEIIGFNFVGGSSIE